MRPVGFRKARAAPCDWRRAAGAQLCRSRSGAPRLGWRGICLRKPIHVSIGEPYVVSTETPKISQQRMSELTDELMLRLAALLPERYWGVYRERMVDSDDKLTS